MKLQTSITPRRNGTVVVDAKPTAFTFLKNEEGDLECDVTDDALVAILLGTGNFYPSDVADFEAAKGLIKKPVVEEDGVDDDDDGDDEGDDPVDMTALPIEGATPPVAPAPVAAAPVSRRRGGTGQ